jgi:hypothetical protein
MPLFMNTPDCTMRWSILKSTCLVPSTDTRQIVGRMPSHTESCYLRVPRPRGTQVDVFTRHLLHHNLRLAHLLLDHSRLVYEMFTDRRVSCQGRRRRFYGHVSRDFMQNLTISPVLLAGQVWYLMGRHGTGHGGHDRDGLVMLLALLVLRHAYLLLNHLRLTVDKLRTKHYNVSVHISYTSFCLGQEYGRITVTV